MKRNCLHLIFYFRNEIYFFVIEKQLKKIENFMFISKLSRLHYRGIAAFSIIIY